MESMTKPNGVSPANAKFKFWNAVNFLQHQQNGVINRGSRDKIFTMGPSIRPERLSSGVDEALVDPCSLYACLKPILTVGNRIFYFNFKVALEDEVEDSGRPKFTYRIHTSKWRRAISVALKMIITIYLWYVAAREKNKAKEIPILEILWKCTFSLFVTYIITCLWAYEFNRAEWKNMFLKADAVLKDLHKFQLTPNFKLLRRAVLFTTVFHVIFSLIHSSAARALNKRFPNITHLADHLTWVNFPTAIWHVAYVIGTWSIDFLAWGTWHFSDTLRMSLSVYIWLLYFGLNRGISEERITGDKLYDVMCLHLKISNLIRTVNKVISPITFIGSIFAVCYSCFYLNFLLVGKGSTLRKFLFAHFLLKNFVIYLVSADINSKAHSISEWLETLCATEDQLAIPREQETKLVVFTSQLYSRDSIGIKGLQFFTISTGFLAGVASIIASYTVVISQLSDYSLQADKNKTMT